MIGSKKVVGIIPARGGSKGIPRKNIKNLCGKPLIAWTIEEALKSKYIDRLIVSTEDKEIAEISREYGAEVPFLRPVELARDDTPGVEPVLHCINWLKTNENFESDYVCVLQCTSPLRTYRDINLCLEKVNNTKFDGIISVCEVETNPYWTNIFEGKKLIYFLEEGKKIKSRQALPKIYKYNGAIYIIRKEILIKKETLETDNMTGYIMDNGSSIDIDSKMDFKFAELLIRERENNA
ncbi:acylneuraminate cytidylyltransferase family protein [Sporanaerobacter sp. PP17-6a]|uniref:acylneuraminate cytidylyltransferase family protein n=1 Tax=Sporanaerobacter sp. PP17-6a TaxID=1891289 RepID=UPI00089FA620|nr:acylneuraminate cytidylyltransferase family protein [Sporanaerobacter sp. PP17-6a]SCL91513.1 N-acylneuraminate cytidylyltransferase [Sporanaerobacter sp. PP17-6a]